MKKSAKGKPGKGKRILLYFIFLIGLGVVLYPFISNYYYTVQSSQVIDTFDTEKETLSPEELEERIGLAEAYNESLWNAEIAYEDPYAKDRMEKGRAEYARMLEIREQMGHIKIPKIQVDLPVYAGTSEEILQKGVGHMEGTSLPIGGNNTHAVLTAHRGLPDKKLFTDLIDLEVGDRFYITNIKETIAYQVDQILVIEPSEFENLMIVPGHDYVTLLTCTPYMINSHRLLVRGHRIEYVNAIEERDIQEQKKMAIYKYVAIGAAVLVVILLLIILKMRRQRKKLEKEILDLKVQLVRKDE